jgi:hypothetical protein
MIFPKPIETVKGIIEVTSALGVEMAFVTFVAGGALWVFTRVGPASFADAPDLFPSRPLCPSKNSGRPPKADANLQVGKNSAPF